MDAGVLKQIPFFADASDEEAEAVAKWADEVSVSEGKQIVREGDFSYDFFIIQDGKAAVKRGEEEIAELGPGDFFGESGVVQKQLRSASVVAKTPMRLITLNHWDLDRLKKQVPQMMERIEQKMAERTAD